MPEPVVENPYQSPATSDFADADTSELLPLRLPLPLVIARFHAERLAMGTLSLVLGGACVVGVLVVLARWTGNLGWVETVASVAASLLPASMVAGYWWPWRPGIRLAKWVLVAMCAATVLGVAWLATNPLVPRGVAIMGAFPLLVLAPCLLQAIRIEQYARHMLAAGCGLKTTSLQAIVRANELVPSPHARPPAG
jgi:hypothetical protein